jgi:iron complex transport system substrate-binding protein
MMKKTLVFLLVTILATLTGCGLFVPQGGGPIELIDDFERTVTLDGPALTIISLAPSSTEILFALGVGDRIIGATEYCNYPEEALDIPRMGAFHQPNIELIVSLEPDLVLAASLHKETVEALEELGIAVLALDPHSFEEVYSNIETLAKATGREEAGQALIEDMQNRLAQLTEILSELSEEDKPLVYYEVWYPDPMTVGGGTFIDSMIKLAGGRNMAGNLSGYPIISEELLIDSNPDVILHGHFDADSSAFGQRPGWESINAVKGDRIHFVDQDIVNRTGPRMVEAVEIMARLFHPDLFD